MSGEFTLGLTWTILFYDCYPTRARLSKYDAAAVAAAEEERDGEDGEDAASTAALEYMESPSLLNNNAAGAASHSRLQDQAAPAEALEQREEPEEEQVEVPSDLRQAIVAVPGTDLPAQEYHEASSKSCFTLLPLHVGSLSFVCRCTLLVGMIVIRVLNLAWHRPIFCVSPHAGLA